MSDRADKLPQPRKPPVRYWMVAGGEAALAAQIFERITHKSPEPGLTVRSTRHPEDAAYAIERAAAFFKAADVHYGEDNDNDW